MSHITLQSLVEDGYNRYQQLRGWTLRYQQTILKVYIGLEGFAIVATICLGILISGQASPAATPRVSVPIHSETTAPSPRLAMTLQAYGPWTVAGNDTLSKHVAYVTSNGALALSSQILTSADSWAPTQVPDFRSIVPADGDTFVVSTTSGAVYHFTSHQVIILETHPENLYAITATGTLVSTPVPTDQRSTS